MICVDRKKSLHVGKNFKKVGGHLLYLSGKNLRVSTHLASNVVWHLLVLKDDLYTKPEGERDLSSVTPLVFLEKALLDFCRKSPRYSSLSSIKRSRQKNVYSTVKRKVHKNPGLLSWILSSSTLFFFAVLNFFNEGGIRNSAESSTDTIACSPGASIQPWKSFLLLF